MRALAGQRVLVVGASKGLGRAIAERLHAEGAGLAIAARSAERLAEVVEGCDGRPHAISCDVRDAASCRAMVGEAVEALGGLDGLVYAPGTTVVTELLRSEPEHWQLVFETNVFGAAMVMGAALPHLEASEGTAVFLSSVSAQLNPPWIGMGLYAASKQALQKCVEVWSLEHPVVRCTTIVVGATAGGSFFRDALVPNPADLDRFGAEWRARGYTTDHPLTTDDQAKAVVDVLTSEAQLDVVWVRSRHAFQLPEPPGQSSFS